MTKTQILPIVSVIALLLQSIFHVQITDAITNQITDIVFAGIGLYGIFKDHNKFTPPKNSPLP